MKLRMRIGMELHLQRVSGERVLMHVDTEAVICKNINQLSGERGCVLSLCETHQLIL